jgi:hypothetical protein
MNTVCLAQFPRQFRDVLCISDEPVSLARNSKDVVGLVRTLTERSPKGRHLAGEIVFLDCCVRPHARQQVVLRDESVAIFQQDDEDVEGLRRDCDRLTLAPEPSPQQVRDELTERHRPRPTPFGHSVGSHGLLRQLASRRCTRPDV